MFLIFILVAIGAAIAYPMRRSIVDVFANDKNILEGTDIFLQTLLPTLPFFSLFLVSLSIEEGLGIHYFQQHSEYLDSGGLE
ncbi:MAG: hypothetical protein QW755_00305 [Nitrososphaerota archaeon]